MTYDEYKAHSYCYLSLYYAMIVSSTMQAIALVRTTNSRAMRFSCSDQHGISPSRFSTLFSALPKYVDIGVSSRVTDEGATLDGVGTGTPL